MHSFCKNRKSFRIKVLGFIKKICFLSNISRSCLFFTYFLVPLHRILRNTYIYMTRKTKLHEIRDYVIIALAMIEGSIGLNIFLLPNHITMGGVGGIASILYWGFGIPASVSYLALNVFLLLIAFRILGYKFCLKTIYGVGIFALTTRLIETHTVGMTPLLHDQPFMAIGHRCVLHGQQCRSGSFLQWFYGWF